MSWTARALRQAYRRELLPPLVLWTLAAGGLRDWIRGLERPLRAHLGDKSAARALLAEVMAEMFRRRYAALRQSSLPRLPASDERAVAGVMAALLQLDLAPKARWLWDGLGGPPRGIAERLRGHRLVASLPPSARWREAAGQLGEFLIVFTELAPRRLPRAAQALAQICFDMGVRYAEHTRRFYGIPADAHDAASAIEVLRMSEYVFHVNPRHWSGSARGSAFLEGTACLWWARPGWSRMHCGIFGQFQSGVCSVFGLDYKLDRTIPKHGGDTCRVTMSPLATSRSLVAERPA